MAYIIRAIRIDVCWVPDGAGPMEVASAQSAAVTTDFGGSPGMGGPVVVPGGDSPTGANLTTAAATLGTNLGAALNSPLMLARIQGWSTGNP